MLSPKLTDLTALQTYYNKFCAITISKQKKVVWVISIFEKFDHFIL